MKILIVAATTFEILPLTLHLQQSFQEINKHQYQRETTVVTLLITGVGIFSTMYSLTKQLIHNEYDLIINAGIAGAKNNSKLTKRSVVQVISEQFGDIGVEEADGSFTDIFDLDLLNPNQPPFTSRMLVNAEGKEFLFLPQAKGITVNKVHGHAESIKLFNSKYEYDVETMEGAAFFYVCLEEKQKFLQIRSISNFVEERNKDNWELEKSIAALNDVLINLLGEFLI